MKPGDRCRIVSADGGVVTADASPHSAVRQVLPPNAIVVIAETRETPDRRVRISSPAGWMDERALEPAAPAPSLWQEFETFERRHLELAPGDNYGIEFPFTLDLFRDFGAAFLTTAFRAAGSISADNQVTEIVGLKPLNLPGASESAFITVAYAKADPDLHTELFVKFPPDRGAEYKHSLAVMAHGEVEMQRLTRSDALPVKAAKYYFGDFSSHTLNYILITERIAFGVAPIEPAYRKGEDQLIPDAREHYLVLTKALAALVAAHKTGALGHELEEVFPFARAARNFDPIPSPETNIDRLIDFIGRIAPQLFPAAATTPAFLQRWREDLLFGLANKDSTIAYLHQKVDYTGLCHPNLNPDNAWYWRDASGELQTGLLDWGGAGQMSIAQALSGMLMMPDPAGYIALRNDVIATFIKDCADKGGPSLSADELLFQYKASLTSTAICTIVAFVVDMMFKFTDEEFASMKDRFDSRLQKTRLAAVVIWVDNILQEWLEDETPGDAWRKIAAQTPSAGAPERATPSEAPSGEKFQVGG